MAEVSRSAETGLHQSVVTWTGASNGGSPDTFAAVELARKPDGISFGVDGTFGVGGTVALHGSLDGTNYYAMDDLDGSVISLTAAGIASVRGAVRYIKPVLTSGDGTTDLNATLLVWFDSK